MKPGPHWWGSSSGRIELHLTMDQARFGGHTGHCDADIAELRRDPSIIEQLSAIEPATLRAELREYGAWSDAELANHDANLSRLLWIACSDIREESPNR
jgi:hypothetical protein